MKLNINILNIYLKIILLYSVQKLINLSHFKYKVFKMEKIKPDGNLSTYSECNKVFKELQDALESVNEVTLDVENVVYMSSAGIGRMASLDKSLWGSEKKVFVVNISKNLKHILDIVEVTTSLRNFNFE
jgi:anti-anti-sigma factor